MKAEYICIKDFSDKTPTNVFHREAEPQSPNSGAEYLNKHILYRKKFCVGNFKKAVIRITADDYFKLYLNGKYVFQGPPSGYPQSYYYIEMDVTDLLKKGDNLIAVHAYYQGLVNRVWVSADMRQMLWCELYIDGKLFVCSDTSWKVRCHSGYYSVGIIGYDTQFAEAYNSQSAEAGFVEMAFNDSHWENASIYKNGDYILKKSPLQPLDVYFVQPVKTELRKDNVLFVDFGQETVGYLSAQAQGKNGDEIVLRYGEELCADGTVRYDMRCNCHYEDKWILSGGQDVLEQFDYKAFRYVEIVLPADCEIKNVGMMVRHYPFKQKYFYNSENAELNKILNLCINTVKYGTQEQFLDCPTREKGQYLGDLAVSGRAQCILTQDTKLIKKSLLDFCKSTFICKGMMAVSCASLNQEIADYSLLFAALCVWVYSQDNDIEFLKKTEPYATGIYEYFKTYEREDYLLDGVDEKWNLVDWPANLRDEYDFPLTKPIGPGKHNVINAFYIGMLEALEETYSALGKEYDFKTEKHKQSFVNTFFNEQTGLFCDSVTKTHSSVHSNILPLLFNIGTDDKEKRDNLVRFICQKKLTSMGTYMSYFALAALVKNGETDRAIELATDKGAWLNMIKEGATTTFEAWGKEQKWNTSLFHPWSVAPLIVFSGKRIY